MKFYRHIPSQIAVFILFQVVMWIDVMFSGNFSLIGAYMLGYLFCILWGNVGYLILSDAFFCLVSFLLSKIAGDICFWYLLFTFVPGLIIIFLRNIIITRRGKRSSAA
jgi:hypothetical protein